MAQVVAYNDKPAEQAAFNRGQATVALMGLFMNPGAAVNPEMVKAVPDTYSAAHAPDPRLFPVEVRSLLPCLDAASLVLPASCFKGAGGAWCVFTCSPRIRSDGLSLVAVHSLHAK